MIVTNIKVSKKNEYIVTIDKKNYKFSEDIVVKYRLVNGKEIAERTLNRAIKEQGLDLYINKAINYTLKYNKSELKVREYLYEKGLSKKDVDYIINDLKSKKLLIDENIIDDIVESLIRKSNGKLMIEHKLYEKGFSKELSDNAISKMDMKLYYDYLIKLYMKVKSKYDLESLNGRQKLNNYLLNRGYTQEDIRKISKR